jgi:glycosyltransferase involved in cell wall biosynthesis
LTVRRVAVVVPARNEAHAIEACLNTVLRSAHRLGMERHHVALVVVADSCDDSTIAVARRVLRGDGHVMPVDVGNAGAARALGTDCALAHLAGAPLHTIWTAHTDADTLVPPSWLVAHRLIAEQRFAALAGTVDVDSFHEHPTGTERRHRLHYGVGGDHHPHVHGANMGVRADAYRAVGGWARLTHGEDHALWTALRRAHYPVLSTGHVPVVTSGRQTGRAVDGFADYLVDLGRAG